MPNRLRCRWLTAAVVSLAAGCEGNGGGNSAAVTPLPGAPGALAVNVGDGAVSLAWTAPANATGENITAYTVSVSPNAAQVSMTLVGTAAVVSGLINGTPYSFSVSASNSAGTGPTSASITATPSAPSMNTYARIAIPDDPNAGSGIFDPSLVISSTGTRWLAYSSVHYYQNAQGQIVQDVSTSVAKSLDSGKTYDFVQTVGAAQGPVAVTDITQSVCGEATCTGRWIYEVPFLIEDATDPTSARTYKLFAHKYFLYPPDSPGTEHTLGTLVMWTASSPDGIWSAETPVLRWNGTPPEIVGGTNINALDTALAACLLVTEGTASVSASGIDFAFNCTSTSGGAFPVNIVLLRSSDHAHSFTYVSTLLTPGDASIVSGAAFFNAPALLPTPGGAPVLMVTPDNGAGSYSGCVIIPFADQRSGTLVRNDSQKPIPILKLPTLDSHFGGACALDHGPSLSGILMDDLNLALPQPFGIVATGRGL